ncbi:hypothetical protein GGR56DRAFT_410861 [Xylariaceae sp. FL0804]|nr:hypothetical protein GGR56DRAFT_410861 [Xylariaceae sp. FL0804]
MGHTVPPPTSHHGVRGEAAVTDCGLRLTPMARTSSSPVIFGYHQEYTAAVISAGAYSDRRRCNSVRTQNVPCSAVALLLHHARNNSYPTWSCFWSASISALPVAFSPVATPQRQSSAIQPCQPPRRVLRRGLRVVNRSRAFGSNSILQDQLSRPSASWNIQQNPLRMRAGWRHLLFPGVVHGEIYAVTTPPVPDERGRPICPTP